MLGQEDREAVATCGYYMAINGCMLGTVVGDVSGLLVGWGVGMAGAAVGSISIINNPISDNQYISAAFLAIMSYVFFVGGSLLSMAVFSTAGASLGACLGCLPGTLLLCGGCAVDSSKFLLDNCLSPIGSGILVCGEGVLNSIKSCVPKSIASIKSCVEGCAGCCNCSSKDTNDTSSAKEDNKENKQEQVDEREIAIEIPEIQTSMTSQYNNSASGAVIIEDSKKISSNDEPGLKCGIL